MKKFLMIFGVLVVFILQVVLSYFIMNMLFGTEDPALANTVQMDGEDSGAENNDSESSSKKKKTAGEADYEFGALYNLGDLILNPRGSKRRIFKISLALEFDPSSETIAEELAAKEPFIRDYLLEYLGEINADTLGDIRFRGALRDSLAVHVSEFLDEGYVDRVLFVDFIRQ